LRGTVTLRDIDLGPALGIAVGAGKLDLDLALATSGASDLDFVSHLSGTASAKARDGKLPGIAASPPDTQTFYAALEASFRIAGGRAKSDDLHLVGEEDEGRGTAEIDLPAWRMESRLEVTRARLPTAPPVAIRVAGPLDHPRASVEPAP